VADYIRLEGKHSRCLTTILARVETTHFTSRLRYLLTQWRGYVAKRKRSLALLGLAMKKSMAQAGFNEIRWFSRDMTRARRMDRVLSRFFSVFTGFA
jgi:hypothetical protein